MNNAPPIVGVVNQYDHLVWAGKVTNMRGGQPAIAVTVPVIFGYSTKTKLDAKNFEQSFRDVQIVGKDANVYFANVLLHEVFWLGIVEGSDRTYGATPLLGGSAPNTLIPIRKDEAQLILDEIGFD